MCFQKKGFVYSNEDGFEFYNLQWLWYSHEQSFGIHSGAGGYQRFHSLKQQSKDAAGLRDSSSITGSARQPDAAFIRSKR
jgi:hypothetical protein